MREPSTLELAAIARELEFLNGFYIEKFYELPGQQFRLKLNKSGIGQQNLVIVPARFLGIASVLEQQDQPTNFSQAVRKRISNFHITGLSLLNDDRVLSISMEKGDQKQSLIIEMFGKGNVIIADPEMKITLAYSRHEFSDRKIFPGETYIAPKNKRITISNLQDKNAVEEAIKSAPKPKEKNVMQALSSIINIGSIYLEDAVIRLGIDPSAPSDTLAANQITSISEKLSSYSAYIKAPQPRIYKENGFMVDYSICDIKKYEGMEPESFESTYEALENYYLSHKENQLPKISTKVKELESSIRKQKEIIEQTAKEIGELKSKGDAIYNNMQLINSVIKMAREMKRFSKEDIEQAFGIKVSEVNLKDKTLTIEL
ncbi:MAG: hypothetical protein BK997_00795 [Candidatus Micrarchaeum sp. ARMAN-1]|nr:MAG: hypothetical protein BK997_00795 [Candidatus Micrarchaeum sp. ARMAN-1]